MSELALGLEKTMTVKEIAEALGMAEITIRKKAAELFPDCVKNGVATRLNERQVTQLKQSLTPRNLISKYKVDSATTDLEMFQNIQKCMQWLSMKNAELQAEIEAQKQELKEAAPKVEFYNAVTDSKDCIDIGQVAKVLNVRYVGRNKLFEILRNKNVLDRKNQPYQKYVDLGYFRVVETSFSLPDGTQKINLKTVVFQKGVDFIRNIVKDYSACSMRSAT